MKTRIPFRRRPGVILLAAAMVPFYQQAFAQQETIEEVIVTGSRIARDSNLVGALPVQSLTADDIAASGEFSLSDIVNDIPALLSSLTAEQSNAGSQRLNLRALGQNRTLTLVDGRRHVGGLQGSSSVDIGSIPQALVERVEVLTGGASAVYGADAVTGVVNFILRDDYEGLEIDARYASSEYGDAQQAVFSLVYGENFANGRGNITFSADVREDAGLKMGERADGYLNDSAGDWANPDLRFQKGDIGPNTPNFATYYDYATTGLYHYGLGIPTSADDFIADYTDEFGVAPSLTAAETALINRAANAPARGARVGSNFTITSGYGYIVPGNAFTFTGFDPDTPIDLDGNGTPDCLDSFTGYNSSFSRAGFGAAGGCWNIEEDGTIRPIRDSIIASSFNGFGGDSFNVYTPGEEDIVSADEKISLNLFTHYDLTDTDTAFAEVKYVTQEAPSHSRPTSFWDLLYGAPDNPFLPEFIRGVAEETGGVGLTVDPLHFDSTTVTARDTVRFVAGLEGEFENGWTYEVSANYGRYDSETTANGQIILDRFFAAIDAVTDEATGQPACRADVNPDAPALNTPFGIPSWDDGYFSYTPGSGDCVPLNLWAGKPGASEQAIDWVTYTSVDEITLDQLVFSGSVVGDSSEWFELPGGPVGFAAGAEWREESSDARFDPWQRGVIPPGSPHPAGSLISDHSDNGSLGFDPSIIVKNEYGEYDATDVFLELSLPLLANAPGFRELTLDVAGRLSSYSTVGDTESWKLNLVWAPVEDIAVRGSLSQAVRAPNITELFGPEVGATARPADPCDIVNITALAEADATKGANTQANCVEVFQSFGLDPFDADGNYVWTDPLSARFTGVSSGNRDLTEETADTLTYGFVFTPSFLPGFSLTVDIWDISIDDGISSVTVQDIVDGCYQGASLNQAFCSLIGRNTDVSSAQAGGFNFFRTTDINFAIIEADGIDLSASYNFDIGEHGFRASVTATEMGKLDFYTNPLDLTEVNPELGEMSRPEQTGNVYLGWTWGDLSVGWQSQYLGEMLLGVARAEIETYETLFGPSLLLGETWVHDLNARYVVNDELTVYGGINNVTQTNPFISENAFPATPRGRVIFLGGTYRL